MPAPALRSAAAALTLATASLFAGGCDLIDAFTDPGETLVTVFANHHATPENGAVPDRGGAGEVRVFDTDEGWTINLTEGVITTRGVTLHGCNGSQTEVDMYFGAHAEDLCSADLDRRTVGGVELSAQDICGMTVHYGAFAADTDEAPATMEAGRVDGSTVFLAGFAEKNGEVVEFEVHTPAAIDVFEDFSDSPRGPVRIKGDEPFPVELTVTKTYDRFFDGVDFTALDADDLGRQAEAILELETRVQAP
ncbi:MAG: hypothetical protein AAGA54_01930 [Myxococcota bacterium]